MAEKAQPVAEPQVEEVTQEETQTEETPTTQYNEDGDIKINLDAPVEQKPEDDALQQVQGEATESVLRDERVEEASSEEAQGESEAEEEVTPNLEKITDEENNTNESGVAGSPEAPNTAPKQEKVSAQVEAQTLPEGVDKLVKFIEETGGTIEEYAQLNLDLDSLDEDQLVRAYYKQKYPNNSDERLQRRINKDFSYNEEIDDADVIQDKKDLFEDTVFEAKKFLSDRKETYYAELKSRRQSQLPEEAQEALSYYNEQKQLAEQNEHLTQVFLDQTDKVFNDDFKGFDFKVGDDKFRFKVNDIASVKEQQSNLMNLISKFAGEDGSITDAAGYHKAIFAANNVDLLAQHFYEQGKADGINEVGKSANNIDMGGRQDHGNNVTGKSKTTARVVEDAGSSGKLKVNWPPKN